MKSVILKDKPVSGQASGVIPSSGVCLKEDVLKNGSDALKEKK